MKEVIDYVNGTGFLPKKPIVLSFDDGYYNNYYYAFPLLKKYNMKAVISIVGKLSDDFSQTPDENPSYAHLTWDDILEMHLSGCWEIQNHSYNCHSFDHRNGVSDVYKRQFHDHRHQHAPCQISDHQPRRAAFRTEHHSLLSHNSSKLPRSHPYGLQQSVVSYVAADRYPEYIVDDQISGHYDQYQQRRSSCDHLQIYTIRCLRCRIPPVHSVSDITIFIQIIRLKTEIILDVYKRQLLSCFMAKHQRISSLLC